MATFSELSVRLALAYILVISGIDTLSHNLSVTAISQADYALLVTALVSIVGGLLLAIGWQLAATALVLAVIVLLSAIFNASLIAALFSIGLFLLWYRTTTAQGTAKARQRRLAGAAADDTEGCTQRYCRA